MRRALPVLALACGLLLAPAAGRAQVSDPIEPVNRVSFAFNALLLDYLIDPVSQLYVGATSAEVRQAASNFFANLREPFTALSNLLDGRWDEAGASLKRFAVNSTLGIAGLRDRAAADGTPAKARDLSAALCPLDLPAGPYLVVPLVGPTTVRDSLGALATLAIQYGVLGGAFLPYYVAETVVRYGEAISLYRDAIKAAPDTYAAVRAAYAAHRAAVCAGLAGADKSMFLR